MNTTKVKEILVTKATVTTATDRGEFTAVISTQRTDREGDVVLPQAMLNALKAWDAKGKPIPLAWSHLADDPAELVGHINPASAKAVNGEVVVAGWIDRDTPRGQQVWRLVKSNTVGFSYGYMVLDAVKRADGAREIRKLDIFEVSATATPMNADTRVLGWKATEPELPEPTDQTEPEPPTLEESTLDEEGQRIADEWSARISSALNNDDKTLALETPETLRQKSDRLAKEFGRVEIAEFPC
jgi:HK97 family phage prohead protease